MKHIDEHTLDLYVLGAPEVSGRRREIEAHLKKCMGCKALADHFSQYYHQAGTELQLHRLTPLAGDRSIMRGEANATALYEASWGPIRQSPRTRLDLFRQFARRHPLAAGTGSFVALTIVAGLAILLSISIRKDTNPEYYHLNLGQEMFEVYNREHQMLWQIPAPGLSGVEKIEREHGNFLSKIVDLDGDGKNEVITAIPSLGSDHGKANVLQVFSSGGTIIKTVEFGEAVQFRGAQYHGRDFGAYAILVEDFAGSGAKEIIVAAASGRSPFLVERFDASGRLMGEYWHFGTFYGVYAEDLKQDGKKEVILCGVNDAAPLTEGVFAPIVVLDPTKIVGKTESLGSPGFGFTPSSAEVYYLRLPQSDINEASHSKAWVTSMRPVRWDTLEALSFWQYGTAPQDLPMFEYIFSRNMSLLAVKSEDRTIKLRDSLVETGVLKGRIDATYLDRLKEGVKYWNGKEWTKEVTEISALPSPR